MSAATYPILAGAPVPIAAGAQGVLTLYNSDITETVYLSENPDNRGFPLAPGSSMTWDQGKTLYAYVDAGATVQLVVLDNGGTITNTGAIAQQILAGGLADQIAASIVGSALAGAIADAIAIQGAPPLDVNALVASGSTPAEASVLPTIDVSQYQSITLTMVEAVVIGDPKTAPLPRKVNLVWEMPDGNATHSETVYLTDDHATESGAFMSYQTPVKNGRLSIAIGATAQGMGASIIYRVIGSYKAVSRPRYTNRSAYWGGAGSTIGGIGTDNFVSWRWGAAAGTNQFAYPTSKAGSASLSFRSGTTLTAGTLTCFLIDIEANEVLAAVTIAPAQGTTPTTVPIILPNRPVKLQIIGGATMAPAVTGLATLVYAD